MGEVKNIAATLRRVLLGNDLTDDERRLVLFETGLCLHCGGDEMRPDGTRRNCQCWNDE